MTKKDYIKIAEILRVALINGGQCNSDLVDKFAEMLKADSQNFKKDVFVAAVYK